MPLATVDGAVWIGTPSFTPDLVPVWDAVLHSQRTNPEKLDRIVTVLRPAPSSGEG